MISLVRAKCRAVPGPVWVIAIGFGAILVGTSGFYDYSGDEFYFLAIGKHLAWGYDDQPPLVPLLARGISEIFPNSPVFLRLPAAAFAVAGVVLAALLAREFGGSRRAQALAAAAYVSSPLIWYQGSLLSTATIDTALIALIAFLLVRWTRLRRDGALLIAGLVTAVALQVKYLVPIFWAAVLGALVLFGPREMLRRPMLWLGFGFAGTSSVPAVLWQSRHGWPQLEMTRAIAAEQDAYFGGQGLFPPFLFVLVGIVTGAATAGFGLWTLLRSPRLRPYRFLGFVPLVLAAAIWLADGRPYYVAGVLPVLWAAAGVELERTGPERWLRPLFATPVWVVSTLLGVVAFVPAYPGAVAELNPLTRTQMGWHEFAADIARQAHELTRADGDVAVLARHYPHAAALDHYREELALPPVHSGGRSYWYFGAPSPQTRTVVAVGYDSAFLRAMFAEVVSAGMADNRYENLVLGAQPVWICRDPARPWSELWPAFHTLRVVD
ncbi:ArnT family glycosyltransferase [Amycolatopsis sp. CA-230715]|uniref:ArnT family glycosyltransferase n=1 Tax=Amycolatopsis sp. CA-230715 TaxID=2745196 RepID=UPI001C020D3E|nr:glycosyltransferase family 39 protein [Amycolatopsis sp. CA-230715]QWF81672.1 hypothetical protein HUW46_05105 [Amycolatopsis sp. CA-230715]